MRLVRVKAPEGAALEVARLAFEKGISQVSVHQEKSLTRDGREQIKDVVDVETATPTAKALLDALIAANTPSPCDNRARSSRDSSRRR